MSRYKLFVHTHSGKTLFFTIESYKILEGNFLQFTDERTGHVKCFHTSRCELEVI